MSVTVHPLLNQALTRELGVGLWASSMRSRHAEASLPPYRATNYRMEYVSGYRASLLVHVAGYCAPQIDGERWRDTRVLRVQAPE